MILLLDAGNSRFKWARLSQLQPIALGSKAYGGQGRAESVIDVLDGLCPQRLLVASVLDGSFAESLRCWAGSKPHLKIQFIKTCNAAHGVRIAYAEPEHLGVDRFVALVGAHRYVKTASIVIDCGTAVTLDALTSDGEHLGGLILPGLEMMRGSLVRDTSRINLGDDSPQLPLLAQDTAEAVLSGTLRMLVAAIERIAVEMETELAEPVTRVLCGGDALRLIPWLSDDYQHDPLLVAKGLAVFALSGQA
jgi:type III pantothenate kinase